MTKDAILHDLREKSTTDYNCWICAIAADLIENQAKALDALTLANMALKEKAEKYRWIPVEEALPENMDWMLCQCADGHIRVLRYDRGVGVWALVVSVGHAYSFPREAVTHWRPLPEPPKEAE